MKKTEVIEIIRPYNGDVPLDPFVKIDDKIIDAVELMVEKDLSQIPVVRNRQAIGIIRLEDALRKLGLQVPRGRKGSRSLNRTDQG